MMHLISNLAASAVLFTLVTAAPVPQTASSVTDSVTGTITSDNAASGTSTANDTAYSTIATQNGTANAAVTSMPVLQRPDRQRFGTGNAPFIAFEGDGKNVDWYTLPVESDMTTLVASKVTTLPGQDGKSATVGDMIVVGDGVVAEAIGLINEDGSAGELFDIIACNAEDSTNADCQLIDYDGTSTKSTVTDETKLTTSQFPVAGAAPTGLAAWAAAVMTVKVDNGQSGGVSAGAQAESTATLAAASSTAIGTSATTNSTVASQ